MAKRYVCNACHKSCRRDITLVWTRLAAIAWRAFRARSPTFASPATAVTDILEFGRVSLTTSRAPQRENPYANVKDVARGVECS